MIYKEITDTSRFYQWLQQSNSYKDNFTYAGANAVQAYYEDISSDDQNVPFAPVAWCCEFSEYYDLKSLNEDYNSSNPFDNWEQVEENTTVIKFNGGYIVGEF